MIDQINTTVKKITRTRKQMEDEIDKAANESTKTDHYTCPLCYSHEPKPHVDIHKKTCSVLG